MKKKNLNFSKKLLLNKEIVTAMHVIGGTLYTTKCADPTRETRCMGNSGGPCGGGPDQCFPTWAECRTLPIAGCDGGTASLGGNCDITAIIPTKCNCAQTLANC